MDTYQLSDFLGNDVILYFGMLIFLEYIVLFLQGKPTPRFNDTLTSINLGIFQECFRIAMRGFEMCLYYHLHEHYRLIDLSENSGVWLELFTALLMDFGYYWIHRANHEINILWAQHQVHHSSDDFSMSVGVRHGILNHWLSWILYSPLALLIPPSQFIFHLQTSVLYQFWIHTETVENLGPVIEWIFNTPEHHRIHHGCNKYLLDKNYGGVLIIWDRIFGTYQERREKEKTVYSLIFPPTTFNLILIQTYYYAPLWNRLKHFDNWTNRMEALFKGPSWQPGSPWTGWEHLKMSVTERPKFEVLIPPWKKYYIAIHFLLLVLTNFQFQPTFSKEYAEVWMSSYIFLSYIVTTLIIFSCLLDGRPTWICFMEFGRCVFFLLVQLPCFYKMDGVFWDLQQMVFYISAGIWGYLAYFEYSCKCCIKSWNKYSSHNLRLGS